MQEVVSGLAVTRGEVGHPGARASTQGSPHVGTRRCTQTRRKVNPTGSVEYGK